MQNSNSRRFFLKTTGLSLGYFALHKTLNAATYTSDDVLVQKQKIFPPRLKQGSLVAVTSPAGAVWNDKLALEFTAILEGMGFRVQLGKTLTEKYGYLAGTDALRAEELNQLFKDKNVDAIFTAKGGWGCARLLDSLDYNAITENPKIIMGFSDITVLLNAIYAKTGLVTFHGPVGNSSWGDFSMQYVKQILMEGKTPVLQSTGMEKDKHIVLRGGKSKGTLVGGNLTVLAALMGSNYLPDWKNKILFLEETAEEPYRIDRMLTQLKLNGVLQQLSGLVFGKCVKCEAEEPDKAFTAMQVLEQHIRPLNIPAFYGGMIGHIENKWTLPVGLDVEMDADLGIINLCEPAVA